MAIFVIVLVHFSYGGTAMLIEVDYFLDNLIQGVRTDKTVSEARVVGHYPRRYSCYPVLYSF